jgi:hypothetical protein
MSVTKTKIKKVKSYDSEEKVVVYEITFDTSYPTGGEECDFTDEFPNGIASCAVEANSSGYLVCPNQATRAAKYATGKCDLQAFRQTAATGPLVEVPAATNLATVVVTVIVTGSPF